MTLNPKLDNTCVLCLPFEEPDGSIAYDISNYGNHGTIYGATRTLGKIRKALSFNGANNYVRVPNSPSLQIVGDLTISFWIYIPSLTNNMVPVDKYWAGEYFIKIYTDGRLAFAHGAVGNYEELIVLPAGSVVTGRWMHLAVVRTTSNTTLLAYENGVAGSPVTYSKTPTTSTERVDIGMEDGKYNPVNGLIDEVRIYSRALSAKEVYTHYIYGIQSLRRPRFPEFRAEVRKKLWPSAVV